MSVPVETGIRYFNSFFGKTLSRLPYTFGVSCQAHVFGVGWGSDFIRRTLEIKFNRE